jgi:hypothetical protein
MKIILILTMLLINCPASKQDYCNYENKLEGVDPFGSCYLGLSFFDPSINSNPSDRRISQYFFYKCLDDIRRDRSCKNKSKYEFGGIVW